MTRRRSSKQITLVLIGSTATTALLSACDPDPPQRAWRDEYATSEDCAADWGRPADCEAVYRSNPGGGGGYIFRGPAYYGGYRDEAQSDERFRAGQSNLARSDRAIGRASAATSSVRGGFGSSARSFSMGG